jgi:peptide/nickel transport system substrate-binding protein
MTLLDPSGGGTSITRRSLAKLLGGGAFLASLGSAALTASCAPQRTDGSRRVLRVAWGSEPTDLVPLTTSAGPAQFVGSKLFDGLLTYDYDLKPVPQLASAWEISADGLRYTFTLRDGMKFSDGTPLTSSDVAFSIEALKTLHPRGRNTFAPVERIETPDVRTVILHLSRPAPFLISAFASAESPIVPKHIFKGLQPGARLPVDRLVGSGPFIVKEWINGSYMLLERNPHYWDAPRPFLDQIIMIFIKDPSSRAAALEAGEVDLLPEDSIQLSDVARFKKMPGFTIDRGPYDYYGSIQEGVSFNLENRYLRDVRVRQAIAHAIDVEALIKKLYFGYAVPSPTAITPYQKRFFDASIPAPIYDPALGNRMLDQAGYPRGADGNRFGLRMTWNTVGGLPPQAPLFYREQLASLGIDATIHTVDFATYTRLVFTDRAWDIAIDRYGSTFDPTVGTQRWYDSRSFKRGVPFANPAHYANPQVDRLWDAAAVEADVDKRADLFRQLQQILARDIPILPQIVPDRIIAVRRDVRGYALGATGTLNNFAHVHFDPPR